MQLPYTIEIVSSEGTGRAQLAEAVGKARLDSEMRRHLAVRSSGVHCERTILPYDETFRYIAMTLGLRVKVLYIAENKEFVRKFLDGSLVGKHRYKRDKTYREKAEALALEGRAFLQDVEERYGAKVMSSADLPIGGNARQTTNDGIADLVVAVDQQTAVVAKRIYRDSNTPITTFRQEIPSCLGNKTAKDYQRIIRVLQREIDEVFDMVHVYNLPGMKTSELKHFVLPVNQSSTVLTETL